jgi:hypothetical protein
VFFQNEANHLVKTQQFGFVVFGFCLVFGASVLALYWLVFSFSLFVAAGHVLAFVACNCSGVLFFPFVFVVLLVHLVLLIKILAVQKKKLVFSLVMLRLC